MVETRETKRGRSLKLRLTVATAALIAGLLGLSLGAVYWVTVGASRRAVDRSVQLELDELLAGHAAGGGRELESELERRMGGGEADHGFLYLYSERSRTVMGNMTRPEGLEGVEGVVTFTVEEREVRAYRVVLDDGRDLVVARDVTADRDSERKLLTASLIAAGLAILLAIGGGLMLGHNLLGRVQRMNRTIVAILGGKRDARVPTGGREDEFEELARHFNTLLDENERLIEQMRGVTDDIAHDLRTPLARIRGRVEAALAQQLTPAETTDVLQEVLTDTNGLLETFQALLSIARIESGTVRESMAPVDLGRLALDAVELYEPLAEEAGVVLEARVEQDAVVRGNRHLLSQALTNLIDNAIKFSSAPGRVEVCVRRDWGGVELRVADRGPGIPAEERERVLQRFVRLDRSRHTPGTGLGLSLVAAVARLHGARLRLEDNRPGLIVSLLFEVQASSPRG